MKRDSLPTRIRRSKDLIRFYFDESIFGVGRIVARARADTAYPSHPRCPIKRGASDEDWLPIASDNNYIVVLLDGKIFTRPRERAVLARNKLRLVVLIGYGESNVWDQLVAVVRRWDAIEKVVEYEQGPWLYKITEKKLIRGEYPSC